MKYVYFSASVFFLLAGLLLYGNPQWNKYIYMTQVHWFPGDSEYEMPNGYSGTFKEWNEEGVLVSETEYLNGVKNGLHKKYYDDGLLRKWWVYVDGESESRTTCNYFPNGKLMSEDRFTSNYKLTTMFSENGDTVFKQIVSGDNTYTLIDHID